MDRTKYDLKITNDAGAKSFQSLDKVETAFKIIECLLDLRLESKEEINDHKFIRYTLLLSKDELTEKTPNIQDRYKRNLENHDLYFSRMWNKEELENIITYVEKNYAKVFSISESIQNSDANINLLPEILEVLEEDSIIEFCELEEFRYQKGSDKLIEFENHDGLTKEEITLLLNQFNESGLTFTNFVEALNIKSAEYQILTLLGELVSYCDLHAANKKVYNQYDDNRTLGKAGVRMNDWLDKLLTYKIEDNDLSKLTPSIKNALLYLKDPENGLTMLSANHREKFSIKLLHKTYEPENIIHDLISFFEPYEIDVENEENRTSVYCKILYSKNVSQLWLNDNNNMVSEKKSETKKMNDMNIPLNQIFYGPPGTGKTFIMSSKSEEIIQDNFNQSDINSLEDDFNRIVTFIRANFNEKDHNVQNGKNLYRNLSRILNIWGYILDAEFDGVVTLDNKRLKLKGSNWPQHYRYVTHFGFVDDWRNGKEIRLNTKGEQFKSQIKDWLSQNTNLFNSITVDFDTSGLTEDQILIKKGFQFLRTHVDPGASLPNVFVEKYKTAIINEPSNEDISGFIKSFYCALFMAIKGDLYGHKSSDKPKTQSEEDFIQEYFDLNEKTKNKGELRDLEWSGWITKNLEELRLIQISNSDELNNYFSLTEEGLKLVNSIIDKWKENTPDIFDVISFNNGVKLGFIEFITFHQSYSYEEFIEGIRPNLVGENNLTYRLEKGVFKRISDRAKRDQSNNYVIIIDEINRGNISKIFGELITLIEPSKRLFTENEEHPKQVTLPYSKKLFGVPKNLYILGTMNTADKSISLLDSALRRRFSFTEMLPKSSVIKDKISIEGLEVEKLFETINSRIEFLIDKDHTIGHSYFLKIKDNQTIEALALIFKNEIIPLLNEYFYGDFEKIQLVLGENKDWKSKSVNNFFNKKPSQQKNLFGKDETVEGYDEKIIFELNDDLLGLKEDGNIKGKSEDLIKLFKSVYTKKSN
jgi:hypothetical protein